MKKTNIENTTIYTTEDLYTPRFSAIDHQLKILVGFAIFVLVAVTILHFIKS